MPLSLENQVLIPGQQILSGQGKDSSPKPLALHHAPAHNGSKDIVALHDSNKRHQDQKHLTQGSARAGFLSEKRSLSCKTRRHIAFPLVRH